jgi:uncharacterized membrane protein
MNYWPLLGVAAVVLGFALRANPAATVVVAALVSGIAAGLNVPELLTLLGKSFVANRTLLLFVLTLPTIGLLESAGLRERAQALIRRFRQLTFARLLIAYLTLRQLLSMLGLLDLAGHAQTVRPLLAPMAEAAATEIEPALDEARREDVKALAAATDNIGRFFGEDVFLAFGAVLLIQAFFADRGIALDPRAIALWALPTALAAFAIQATRIWLYQRKLRRAARAAERSDAAP